MGHPAAHAGRDGFCLAVTEGHDGTATLSTDSTQSEMGEQTQSSVNLVASARQRASTGSSKGTGRLGGKRETPS